MTVGMLPPPVLGPLLSMNETLTLGRPKNETDEAPKQLPTFAAPVNKTVSNELQLGDPPLPAA